jgi:dienelactone hydrolase
MDKVASRATIMDIPGFEQATFRHDDLEHKVFQKGGGRGVVFMHELPGLTPSCIRFAERVAAEGFRVYLPLLFGRPNQRAPLYNLVSVCVGHPAWIAKTPAVK